MSSALLNVSLTVAPNMIFGVVDRHSALRRGLATFVTQTRCLCGSNRCDTELRNILTLCGFYMFDIVTLIMSLLMSLSHFRHFHILLCDLLLILRF